jgi:hypothetical protein
MYVIVLRISVRRNVTLNSIRNLAIAVQLQSAACFIFKFRSVFYPFLTVIPRFNAVV